MSISNFDANLFSRLTSDATLSGLVGTRVSPFYSDQTIDVATTPEGAAGYAYIIYEQTGEEVEQCMEGTVGFRRLSYDFTIYSASWAELKTVDAALFNLVSRWRNLNLGIQDSYTQGVDTDYDDDLRLYSLSRSVEFVVYE